MNNYNEYESPMQMGGQQPQMTGSANITVRLEYVWLDGHDTKNIRSKVRYEEWNMDAQSGNMSRETVLERIPEWNFDGSSTKQAKTKNSDVVLHPVRVYHNPLEVSDMASFIILCDTYNPDGTPHETNTRHKLHSVIEKYEESDDMWFSVEQEYTFIEKDNLPVNWHKETPQGENYCGIGSQNVNHRITVEQHAFSCMQAGIDLVGTNAEVLVSQWEYQLGPKGAIETADDLWVSRYLLHRLTEGQDFSASLHPKPVEGEWNGAGTHINFSTEYMREAGDKKYILDVCDALSVKHDNHMKVYGEENEKRLTGDCETQHFSKFTYGVSDRGASVRIPAQTAMDWCGYIEDRRPAANVDPYEAFGVLVKTISSVKVPENITA